MTDHTRPLWADLPHGNEIRELLNALRDLTDVEAHDMYAARDATWGVAGSAALDAAGGAGRADAWAAARFATAGAARASGARISSWDAAMGAALALVIADRAGLHDLTRDHLDVLAAPARTIPRLAKIIDRALPTTPKEN